MLKITVFGPGCARCKEVEKRVRQVVEESGIQADLQSVSDIQAMAKAGILLTPGIALNGVIKASGRIPSESEIRNWIADS